MKKVQQFMRKNEIDHISRNVYWDVSTPIAGSQKDYILYTVAPFEGAISCQLANIIENNEEHPIENFQVLIDAFTNAPKNEDIAINHGGCEYYVTMSDQSDSIIAFSKTPCVCCAAPLAGIRYDVVGYSQKHKATTYLGEICMGCYVLC